jgi:SAM-dependent methyltransferase
MTTITLSQERHGFLADCLADRAEPVARSPRFAVYAVDPEQANGAPPDPDDVILVHDFRREEIDNNIGHFVAEELLPLLCAAQDKNGHRAQAVFERFVGEIVRSMDGSERRAWHLFYDNTLAAFRRAGPEAGGTKGPPAPQDFIADFAAIYGRTVALIDEVRPDTVLDVATCFGFLPLLLADRSAGVAPAGAPEVRAPLILACDLNPALVSLAADYARARGLANLRVVQADLLAADFAQHLGAPCFDVVTAIHLLEHLAPAETAAAMNALWALTGRRLIVAVPVEAEPDARFGHRQVFDRAGLAALSPRADATCRSFEDHGAWLVVDRTPAHGTEGERAL